MAAHVKTARGLAAPEKRLRLSKAWEEYSVSPDRACPATVSEQLAYESTWGEFVAFASPKAAYLDQLTPRIAEDFADLLRKQNLAVDTHNRKIKRIRKVLTVLAGFGANPALFRAKTLLRKAREENNLAVRRLNFTPEQERAIMAALDDDSFRLLNKSEIKVIYYIGLYTGQRLKDCTLMRWNRVHWNLGRIEIIQYKTGKQVSIPMAEPLERILRERHRDCADEAAFVCPNVALRYQRVDARGKNIGAALVDLDCIRVLRRAGITTNQEVPGRKRRVTIYGFHSLRHTLVSRCAEKGIPESTVVSIIGDDADIIAAYYTHVGDEAQRDAIRAVGKLVGIGGERERLEEALRYLDSLGTAAPEADRLREILTGRRASQ